MSDLAKHLLYAIRTLRKSPGFTFSALAILTLGIGANTAIFGIVNAVLLKPLPFPKADSVVTVFHVPPPKAFPGMSTFPVSAGNYLDWKKQNSVFDSMAVMGGRGVNVGDASHVEAIPMLVTEPDFFRVVGVSPAYGRAFTTEECQPGRNDVVVLSYGFAQRYFGSAAGAVGRTIQMDRRATRVIGVMPREFLVRSWFPAAVDAWGPLAWTKEEAAVRGNHNYMAIARMRDGVGLSAAQTQMNVISDRLAANYPEDDKGWGAVVTPLRDFLVGDVRPALLILLGAVGFVLLIACANTANLVLARTITRRKELAIRAALGGSTSQVLLPVLLETTLLAIAGGAIGLLVARSGQSLVMGALAGRMPPNVDLQMEPRVLAFTFAASLLTGVAAGLIACWRLMKIDLADSLKQGLGKSDSYSGGRKTRSALVVAEVALSLILLIGAGLMVRSLIALSNVDPGFNAAEVLTITMPIPLTGEKVQRNRFYDEFLPQVRSLPGVLSVAAIDTLPLGEGGSQQPIVVEGRPAEVFALQPNVAVRVITPQYFAAMGIRFIAGRDFTLEDASSKRAVVVISESMARQFWPGENPLGKRLRISFSPEMTREVVGLVADIRERGLNVLEPVSMLYEPMRVDARGDFSLVVRANGNPMALTAPITAVLQKIDPRLPVRDVASMTHLVERSLSQQRFSMFLFVALAGLAFLLAAVGIYSVLAYNVRNRLQEISIRMALGAQTPDVLRLVVTEGMKPAMGGILVGAFGAWTLSRLVSPLVYGVKPEDPLTFGAVALLLGMVALIACALPAYRATQVEPVKALRQE